ALDYPNSGATSAQEIHRIVDGVSGDHQPVSAFVLPFSGVNPSDRVDLSVQVGPRRLANPIIAASGTFGYGLEFAHLVDLNRLGGFVTKGISLQPLEGDPPPRLCDTPSGMLTAVGLQNVGVEVFVKDKLPLL